MLQKGIDVRDKACYSVPHAKVAQLVEHSTENAGVVGSIPSLGTNEPMQDASSQVRSGLRFFLEVEFFMLTAKLTAKVVFLLKHLLLLHQTGKSMEVDSYPDCVRI